MKHTFEELLAVGPCYRSAAGADFPAQTVLCLQVIQSAQVKAQVFQPTAVHFSDGATVDVCVVISMIAMIR